MSIQRLEQSSAIVTGQSRNVPSNRDGYTGDMRFVQQDLYIKVGDKWMKPSPTTGTLEEVSTGLVVYPYTITWLTYQDSPDAGWTDSELTECAEFIDTTGLGGDQSEATKFGTRWLNNTTFATNGNTLYTRSNGSQTFDATFGQSNSGSAWFGYKTSSGESTVNKIFQCNQDGVLSNVISSAPDTPQLTLSTTHSDQVSVNIAGDMRITRSIQIERKVGSGGTYAALTASPLTPSSKGTASDSNVTTTHTDSQSVSASTTYYYRVRSVNNAHNGDWTVANITTPSDGAAWSNVPADFTITAINSGLSSDCEVSSAKQINLTNADGNTTISCSQSGLTGDLKVAVATDQDPGTNGTGGNANGFAASQTVAAASTYYLRFQYCDLKEFSNDTNQTVTFTNDGVSNTDLQIRCRVL